MAAIELTKDNFEEEVLGANVPVLVDFWASWCGPCRMVVPVIERVADQTQGTAKIGKVNVDEQPELAAKYQIMSIPSLLVFKNGELLETAVGVKSEEELLQMIAE